MNCIEYEGCKTKDGYGHTSRGLAHRVVYFEAFPEADRSMWVLHHCDNPPCINLEHLYLGTPKNNAMDRKNRGRKGDISGTKNGRAVFTDEDLKDMVGFRVVGLSYSKIAVLYNTSASTVHSAVKRYDATRN